MLNILRTLKPIAFLILGAFTFGLIAYFFVISFENNFYYKELIGVSALKRWVVYPSFTFIIKTFLVLLNIVLAISIGNSTRFIIPPSVLAGFFYVILMLFMRNELQPLWILVYQSLSFLIIFNLLLGVENKFGVGANIWSGIFIGILSILLFSSVLLLPVFLICLNFFKSINFKVVFQLLLGFFIPFIALLLLFKLNHIPSNFSSFIHPFGFVNFSQISVFKLLFIFLTSFLIIILTFWQNNTSKSKRLWTETQKRNILIILNISMCLVVLLSKINPNYIIQILAPSLAFLLAKYYSVTTLKIFSLVFLFILVILSFVIDFI